MNYKFTLCVLVGLLGCTVVHADFETTEVNSVLKDVFKCHNNPGVSIALVKNGKVLFTGGYGVTDLQRNNNVTKNTRFNVASVTKNVAAALLIKLLDEKTNLNVNSKVRELLGDDLTFIDNTRTREMTFADVLGHRTGVPPNNILRFDGNLTRENLVHRFAKLRTPDQFRVKYYYNNLMYGLATHISEILGNATWEYLVRKHFLRPLGMDQTTFVTRVNFSRDDVAWPYAQDGEKLVQVPFEHSRRWGLLAGSVSLVTTAEDIGKWMNFHLSKGRNSEGRNVMKEELLDELYTPRLALPTPTTADFRKPNVPYTFSADTYTFGLRRGYYRGYEVISHSGSNHGFRALMLLLPTEGIGAFIAMTGTDDNNQYRQPVLMYLVDQALELKPWLNATTLCSYPEPWRSRTKAITSPHPTVESSLKFETSDYQGVYYNEAYGYLTVSGDNSSGLNLTYGWATWDLVPYNNSDGRESFYARGTGLTVAYNLDPIEFIGNSASGIARVKATGFEKDVPPIFIRVPETDSKPAVTGKSQKGSGSRFHSDWIWLLLLFLCLLLAPYI